MSWGVREVPELRGYAVEWAGDGRFYLSRGNTLFHATGLAAPLTTVATIEAPAWKALMSRVRLGQRLLRFMVTNVVPLPGGDLFVTFDKTVGRVRDGRFFPAAGLRRPCRVLRGACAVSPHGRLYFGEYLANEARGEIHVYEYTPADNRLTVVYSFPAASIKHVHGLYVDPWSDGILCLTGDRDSECRMLRSHDRCRSFEVIGEGDESWRAVSVLVDATHLYYGTDAEFRANRLYRVDRATLERQPMGEVSGTVFYSQQIGDDLFFATTAEDAPSQLENVAALWHVDAGRQCRQLVAFRKDRWHPTWFQFGMIQFAAASAGASALYFHLVGVEEDNRVFTVEKHP